MLTVAIRCPHDHAVDDAYHVTPGSESHLLVQAVVAEYAVTTLFLFFTIGTVASNW